MAATLDPTSVHFRSLTDPEAVVQEQNYEFDLVHADKLLQKYIDQKITAHLRDGKSYEGTLLSFDNLRLVLAADMDKGPIFVVERRQTSFSRIDDKTIKEEFEIKIRKHKKEAVTVKVLEKLYRGSEWRLFNNTQPFDQLDSRTVIFPVQVPADKEATVKYQVEYWS